MQISLDLPDLEKALSIAQEVEEYCDSFELGPLLLYRFGVHAVEQFRAQFSKKVLVADAKIVAHGRQATKMFVDAGADWITVMAGANKNVIHNTCTAAHESNKSVFLDLADACSLGQSALEAKSMGADALRIYKPYDETEPVKFLDVWDIVKGNTELPIYVGGKITRESIEKLVMLQPAGIIIGRAIIEAEQPKQEAEFFKDTMTPK